MNVSVVGADRVGMVEHAGLAVESSSDAGFVLRVERERAGGEEGSFRKLGRRESLGFVEEDSDDDERKNDDQTAGYQADDSFDIISDDGRDFLGLGGGEDSRSDGLAGRGEAFLVPGVGGLDADLVLGVFSKAGDSSSSSGRNRFRFDEVDVS